MKVEKGGNTNMKSADGEDRGSGRDRGIQRHAVRPTFTLAPRLHRLFILAGVFAAACGADKILVCSLLGCTGGLTVHLATLPAAPFRVDVTVIGYDNINYSYDCTGGGPCLQDVFFPGLKAERVGITVRVGGRSRVTDAAPSYSSFRPNGPNCPPDCRTAMVSADIPL